MVPSLYFWTHRCLCWFAVYYWAKITQRRWDDEHGVWLYDLLYNDGDEAVDLKATDMYTMEETLETQRKEPNLGIATLPDGWASPFMSTEEKEKMLGLWKHVYAARRRKRGSKEGELRRHAWICGIRRHF